MMKSMQPSHSPEHEIISPDEVFAATALVKCEESFPDGYIPSAPIPIGFVLHSVLTREEMHDQQATNRYVKSGRKLRYKYGRDAVIGTFNDNMDWSDNPEAIVNAEFIRFNANPLPITSRIKRATSRAVFGIKCDFNF